MHHIGALAYQSVLPQASQRRPDPPISEVADPLKIWEIWCATTTNSLWTCSQSFALSRGHYLIKISAHTEFLMHKARHNAIISELQVLRKTFAEPPKVCDLDMCWYSPLRPLSTSVTFIA